MDSRHLESSPFDFSTLLAAAERLLGEREMWGDRLCQEVEALTRGRALLRLHLPDRARNIRSEAPSGACMYPVEFAGQTYGTLVVMPAPDPSDPSDPAVPALPDVWARQLAHLCGALLCLLNQSAVLDTLSRHLGLEAPEPLTARQREVLTLMARGVSDDEIADTLHIAPGTLRRHRYDLYRRLGVHDAHDLPLVAYHYGLVSYITVERTPPPIAG